MTAETPAKGPEESGPRVKDMLQSYLRSQAAQRGAVIILAFLACTYTLYLARGFLLPIFVALFFSVILRPFVGALGRLKIPRPLGAAMVMLTVLAVFAVGISQLINPLGEWVERLPHLASDLKREFASLRQSIEEAKEVTEQVSEIATTDGGENKVVIEGPSLAEQLFAQAQDVLVSIAATLVLLFFMLAQGREKLQRVIATLPDRSQRYQWREAVAQAKDDVALYLRTVTLINLGLGIATAAAMALIGLPSPILWGVMAGLANFLPYIGPLFVLAFISAASLLSFDSWLAVSLPPLIFFLLTAIEGQFITPSLLGRRLTIEPIAVFLAVLFWGWIWGIPGALLAVPLLTILKIVADRVDSLQSLRALLK